MSVVGKMNQRGLEREQSRLFVQRVGTGGYRLLR